MIWKDLHPVVDVGYLAGQNREEKQEVVVVPNASILRTHLYL